MSQLQPTTEVKDKMLWKMAKKRAGFKRHLMIYIVVNIFLWAVWFFSGGRVYGNSGIPWPLWSTLGWGIGIAFNYFGAYTFPESNTIEKEYQKLKNKQ